MTGDSNIYKYISDNSPDEKINYSYSKFSGIAFIDAWKKSRGKHFPKDTIINYPKISNAANSNTEILFLIWIKALKNNAFSEVEVLNLLIKRFEVTKKIYESYDLNFRPHAKKKYKEYRLYIIFAYVLTLAYQKFGKIQLLNSLLKVNDINHGIISFIGDEEKILLSYCFQKEYCFINELIEKL